MTADEIRRRRRPRWLIPSVLAALVLVGAGVAAGVIAWTGSGGGKSLTPYVDDFQSTPTAMPLAGTGGRHPWVEIAGGWAVVPGGAVLPSPALPRSLIVINTGTSDGQVQTTLGGVVNGTGLAFRVYDENNYWAFTAAPSFATWNIYKVSSGIPLLESNVGLEGTAGPKTIAVKLHGPVLDFYVGAKHVRRLKDSAFEGATKAGLVAVTGDPRLGLWTTFTADVK